MTLTTDQALAALRAADPATGSPASGLSADAVVAGATQPTPGTAVSNIELHVAARQRPGRRHRLRTGLTVAATVVALAGVAIAVTHGNRETVGPATYKSGPANRGPIGAGRPPWSILTGISAVNVISPDGSRTTATDPASLRQLVSDVNALPLDDGHTRLWKCPPPGPEPLTATFRAGNRVTAVATEGSCGILFSLSVPGHGTVTLMGVSLLSLVYGLH